MKKKTILISCCRACSDLGLAKVIASKRKFDKVYRCNIENEIVEDISEIPLWCPLEDVKEK